MKKVLSILALLLMAVTGAWADDTYTVQFKANGNTKTVENVVLPHQFRCNFDEENGELDQIIKELYGWSSGCCCWADLSSSGNENVTCGTSDQDDYITISAPFEGTATVTGWYNNYSTAIKYSLEISIPGYVAPTVNVTGVSLSETTASMTVGGDALTLTATVAPDDATNKTVTWTTSDASVATVADGVVTAVAAGTATITATATNGTPDDTSDDFSATCTVTVTDPATKYDLTLADGSDDHGTVAFIVGGNAATQAKKDDVVTVSVTPNEGYSAKDVTVRAYTSWASANAPRRAAPALQDHIAVTKQENGTWTFTMPEANVWVVVTYARNVQDAWIQAIADQTYTGEAITPTVEVKDGETTLVLNTDYTVAYTNNVETGTATVTVTGTGNYSGTATATFIIRADKSDLNEAITAAEAYYESIKDSNPEAAEALKNAIDAAKAAKDNADASQTDVNNALSTLTTAKTTAQETVLEDTKNDLNDAITAAENYYNEIKDSNPEAAEALKNAIDAAKAAKDNGEATQEDIDNALLAINNAKTTAEETVLEDTKSDLNEAITAAENYYNTMKTALPEAAAALKTAIDNAKAIQEKGDATQDEVDAALAALASAKTTAEQAADEASEEFDNVIQEVNAYVESILNSHPTVAQELMDVVDPVYNAVLARSYNIADAIAEITAAYNAAKAKIASIITVTIPAKSYMARIDGDKRQIENAVDGVKLYSVENVTDTEVVLTGELSVIAAEMPYLIYNDNDTEVEVSIIMSDNDADNVAYDSEHFKGTLVDKTFTGEDMEEADHYVLSNGHSFVWVKDAGTLAAGKCWIQLEKSPANARSLSIVFEEGTTTGINAVNTAAGTEDAAVYDLQGRRVMEPTKKGLYIVNGKKVVIK